MNPVERSTRPYFALPEPLQQRLNSYALAAGAAGVGMLAMTQPAQAKIVYTSAHKAIGIDHKVALDLNHDGKTDFNFHETFSPQPVSGRTMPSFCPSCPPTRMKSGGTNHHASALAAGVQVGPKGRFSYAKKTMAVDYYADGTGGSGTCAGLWNNVKNRYLGLKFSINGMTHFGWARLNVTCTTTYGSHQVTGLLTGYAYETVPNKPIITGKTKGPDDEARREQPTPAALTAPSPKLATLGLLAMGAPALAIWKRE